MKLKVRWIFSSLDVGGALGRLGGEGGPLLLQLSWWEWDRRRLQQNGGDAVHGEAVRGGHPGGHLPAELPLDAHPEQRTLRRRRRRPPAPGGGVGRVSMADRTTSPSGCSEGVGISGAEGHAGVGGGGLELVVESGGAGVGVVGGERGVDGDYSSGAGRGVGYRGGGGEQGEAGAGGAEGEPQDEGQRQQRRHGGADGDESPTTSIAVVMVVVLVRTGGGPGAVPWGILRITRDQRHLPS